MNYIREFQLARGVRRADAYTFTMYVLVGFLAVGLVCNLLVRPLDSARFTTAPLGGTPTATPAEPAPSMPPAAPGHWTQVAVAWVLVGVPLAWGIYRTLTLASQLLAGA